MTKKEILRILDEYADKNYGDIYINQHQEIAKDLLKCFKKQLTLTDVSQQRELLSRFLKQYNQSKLSVSDETDIDLFLNDNKPT